MTNVEIDAPVDQLVGRDTELRQLEALVATPGRLITLDGPGGSGKTRLAIEVARRAAATYRDGAVSISLAGLDDPRHLAAEVSRALGFGDTAGGHPTDRLAAGLRGLELLLVLDNFEHLLDAAGVLSEVRAGCRGVTMLVTSRRRLGIAGEVVVDVGGLSAAAGDETVDRLRATPAVQLFLARAMAVNPALALDDAAVRAIAALCRAVDGLPLAIELIASYCRVLSPDALLTRLTSGAGSLMLTDTIRWSVDLLGERAARLLPPLGVFHDGWSLEAMEAVCASSDDPDLLDALVELIDLHLVEPSTTPEGEMRFRLLETVRRFALDQLDRLELDELFDRHATHFAAVARRCGAAFDSPAATAAIAEIDREWPNIRAALEHLHRQQHGDEGLRAVEALCPFWVDHGPLTEGRQWLAAFLAQPLDDPVLAARARAWDARLAFSGELDSPHPIDGDPVATRIADSRRVLGEAGDWEGWWRAGFHQIAVAHFSGDFDVIDTLVDELLAQHQHDMRWIRSEVLLFWSQSLRERGQRHRAATVTEQAIELARAVRHERVLGRALANYASFAGPDTAAAARAELEPVFSIELDIGDRRGASVTSAIAGLLALVDGDTKAAATWFHRTIEIGVGIAWPTAEARGLAGVAALSAVVGRHVEAARLHGAFRHHGDRMRRGLPPDALELYDALCQSVADQLGDRFELECRAGVDAGWAASLDLARTVATALGADAEPSDDRRRRRRGPRANPELTDRELDVLAELVAGRTNQQIGVQLQISAKTVMHHTMNVYRKLGVRGRAEAVAHALRTGLVRA